MNGAAKAPFSRSDIDTSEPLKRVQLLALPNTDLEEMADGYRCFVARYGLTNPNGELVEEVLAQKAMGLFAA